MVVAMALLHQLRSPDQIGKQVGSNAKVLRLSQNLSRDTLAAKAGVSAQTIRRLETEGQITLTNLILVAVALGCSDGFDDLFSKPEPVSLAELKKPQRQRGSK